MAPADHAAFFLTQALPLRSAQTCLIQINNIWGNTWKMKLIINAHGALQFFQDERIERRGRVEDKAANLKVFADPPMW